MEELLLEIIESNKVEALDELCCTICESSEDGCGANDHLPEPKCGMDELVEKFQALDYLVGSNSEEESAYWEEKAEVHFGI